MKCFEFVFPLLDLTQIFSLDRVDLVLTDFLSVGDFLFEILYRLLELHNPVGKTLSFVLRALESPLQICPFALETLVFALETPLLVQ